MTTPFFPVGQKDDENDGEYLLIAVLTNLVLIATERRQATLPDPPDDPYEVEDEAGISDPVPQAENPEDLKTPVENDDSKEEELIEILDEAEEDEVDANEEGVFHVEKILNHQIITKGNVLFLCIGFMHILITYCRVKKDFNISSNGSGLISPRTTLGKMRKIAKARKNWWINIGKIWEGSQSSGLRSVSRRETIVPRSANEVMARA